MKETDRVRRYPSDTGHVQQTIRQLDQRTEQVVVDVVEQERLRRDIAQRGHLAAHPGDVLVRRGRRIRADGPFWREIFYAEVEVYVHEDEEEEETQQDADKELAYLRGRVDHIGFFRGFSSQLDNT